MPGLDLVIYGVALILVMVYYPGGLAGLILAIRGRIARRRAGLSGLT